jgi:hypothetical protein
MRPTRRQRDSDREGRLREAEDATVVVDEQGRKVKRQLNLVGKLTAGWRKVHEVNHLAQLFTEEGHHG